jgi:hypothetical protein
MQLRIALLAYVKRICYLLLVSSAEPCISRPRAQLGPVASRQEEEAEMKTNWTQLEEVIGDVRKAVDTGSDLDGNVLTPAELNVLQRYLTKWLREIAEEERLELARMSSKYGPSEWRDE